MPTELRKVAEAFCTCVAQPLGLPFTLSAGCLVHDQCTCHSEPPNSCLWCDSLLALFKAVAAIDDAERDKLKEAYFKAKAQDADFEALNTPGGCMGEAGDLRQLAKNAGMTGLMQQLSLVPDHHIATVVKGNVTAILVPKKKP